MNAYFDCLPQNFFEEYWAKKPLIIRSTDISKYSVDATKIETLHEQFAGSESRPRSMGGGGNLVIEGLTTETPLVDSIVEMARLTFPMQRLYCDLFASLQGHGIGSHFDDTDNFTIQISGKKTWGLEDPKVLSPGERQRRLLREPGVGSSGPLGDGKLEFELGEGDLLYIPRLWIHDGTALTDSVSISVVVDSPNLYEVLMPSICRILQKDPTFYQRFDSIDDLDTLTNVALEKLSLMSPEDRQVVSTDTRATFSNFSNFRAKRLRIDMAKIQSYLSSEILLDSPLVEVSDGGSEIRNLVSRRNVKRLLKQIASRYEKCLSDRDKAAYQLIIELIQLKIVDTNSRFFVRPEVSSWLARSERAQLQATLVQDHLANDLLLVFLPEILFHHEFVETPLSMSVTTDYLTPFFTHAELRRRWSVPDRDRPMTMMVNSQSLSLLQGDTQCDEVAWPRLPVDASLAVNALASAPAWLKESWPRTSPELLWLRDSEWEQWVGCLRDASSLMRNVSETTYRAVADNTSIILPLTSKGILPYNVSVQGLRGVIALSARPPYMMAQSLAHEAAHNRCSSLMELDSLALNPSLVVYSPVVNRDRPLLAVIQGAYAFSVDYSLSLKLAQIADAHPDLSHEKYLEETRRKVSESLLLLRSQELTALGRKVCAEIAELVR